MSTEITTTVTRCAAGHAWSLHLRGVVVADGIAPTLLAAFAAARASRADERAIAERLRFAAYAAGEAARR